MTTLQTLPTQVTCRDRSCQHALSHVEMCTCPCGGSSHGSVHQASRDTAVASMRARQDYRAGFTSALQAAIDDMEF